VDSYLLNKKITEHHIIEIYNHNMLREMILTRIYQIILEISGIFYSKKNFSVIITITITIIIIIFLFRSKSYRYISTIVLCEFEFKLERLFPPEPTAAITIRSCLP